MHVVFVEPAFPANQKEFVRGLHAVGAQITGIGERDRDALPAEVKDRLLHYEQVSNVCDDEAMLRAVRWIADRLPIDRLEATVEAHVMTAARVREARGIRGTSVETAHLCRDKPSMKAALAAFGVPCAQSTGARSPDDAHRFADTVGYPLIVKPRTGAGASGTFKVTSAEELDGALQASGLEHGGAVAIEEFVEGHEAFYDTLTIGGEVAYDFITHYYPNVLEAMRTRWISPQFIVTNRIDTAADYDEVRDLGRRVIRALGIDTSPTHMEWFFGTNGLRFSEIGCRPPGVGCWDLYCAANDLDLYQEWARAICWGTVEAKPSRGYSAGMITLRPDRDGTIVGCEGLEYVRQHFGQWLIDFHVPDAGTPTQPVEAGYMANAWIRMKHPDYDELRGMLDAVGRNVQVRAE